MKNLVVFKIVGDSTYVNESPETTSFIPEELQSKVPCDWREEVLNAADALDWDLTASDTESVATMVDFLIAHNPSFSDCIRRSDVQLPGGVVLLDSIAGGEQGPIMLLWEEESVSDDCTGCCKLLRKECPGKSHAELTFSLNGKDPDCCEKCRAECMEDCPYGLVHCEKSIQHLPDGIDIDDIL